MSVSGVINGLPRVTGTSGFASQQDATLESVSVDKIAFTDPLYYDSVGCIDLSEGKNRAAEALSHNALVQSWPEIARLASETSRQQQGVMLTQIDSGGNA